jgi:hypothetical protein
LGTQDPYTFGEAVINLSDALAGSCSGFGSAYLKSRSSDSFTSEIKDYIAPEPVNINLCDTMDTEQAWYPNDTATMTDPSSNVVSTGKVRFRLQPDQATSTHTGHCDATATSSFVYDETVSTPDLDGSFRTSNGPASTDAVKNVGLSPTTAVTYYWLVEWFENTTDTSPKITSCEENSSLSTDDGTGVEG